MTGLKRNLESKINDLLEMFSVVLILGVRQCGKTSLAKMVRPKWKYFYLENTKDRQFITSDFEFFFNEYSEHVIIDEAQEVPELFKNLWGVIDKKRNQSNRFILTGSSSPDLIAHASDSLAGRVGVMELGTLKINEQVSRPLSSFYSLFSKRLSSDSINEIEEIKVDTNLDSINFFLKGRYPWPVLAQEDKAYHIWMQNYFETYINTDIRKLYPRLNIQKFQRFILMLSEMSGTIINRAQLGRSLDVNEVTIRDYIDIAHKTFVWRLIPSYEKSKSKSLVKMPKGIMRDSGLCHYLSNTLTREDLIRSPKVGQNFEAFVIEEIIKGMNASDCPKWEYSYYRTKHGAEVDLILAGSFGVLPIEVKFGESVAPKSLASIKRFVEQEDLPLGIVVNNSQEIEKLTDKIIQVPVSCL